MLTDPADVRPRPASAFVSASEELAGRLAERFLCGGRLLVFADRLCARFAADLVWLFANPPFGRPLPAVFNDRADLPQFAAEVATSSRPEDILIVVSAEPGSAAIKDAFDSAHRRGLLTVALTDVRVAEPVDLDCIDCHAAVRPDYDDLIVGLWRRVQMHLAG